MVSSKERKDNTMKIEFTLEEVETLCDCLIWKAIEEQDWFLKTTNKEDELSRAICKISCRELELIRKIQNKIEEARHTI